MTIAFTLAEILILLAMVFFAGASLGYAIFAIVGALRKRDGVQARLHQQRWMAANTRVRFN